MPQDPNTKRLPIYLTAEELQTIRIAAAYEGRSMASFAREHVLSSARRVIAEQTQADKAEPERS